MSIASFKAAPTGAAPSASDPIKVMVVDDAVVVRGLVGRWIAEESDMTLVASHRSGRDAVADIARKMPDVVILDIEMPDMDGLTALPLLLARRRDLVVIMASTLTRRHAEVSLRALSLGATDYVPKPESNRGVSTSPEFQRELVEKVRHLGRRRQQRGLRRAAVPVPAPAVPVARAAETPVASPAVRESTTPFRLRSGPIKRPQALLIGASTGGPQALTTLIAQLGPVIERVPVLIVQHMPPTFTTILAEHLSRASRRSVREAEDGERIVVGEVRLAPGGRHMMITRRDGAPTIRIEDGAPINFCKPAVDPMFQSASQVWNGAALGVVLTGMGHDGTAGGQTLVEAGGSIIAQDEASSVVWGMPGSVAQAGICSAVLPIEQIGPKLVRIFSGEAS